MRTSVSSASQPNWHLGQLDALRGIAILAVMLVHSVYWDKSHILLLPSDRLTSIAFSGQRGVQLFFLVSAFTLFMSNRSRTGERWPTTDFFIRRIARIAPMLYVAMLLTMIDWPAMMGNRWNKLLSLTLLSGFSQNTITVGAVGAWSVATEAAFYLTLPVLFRILKTPLQGVVGFLVTSQLVFWGLPLLVSHHIGTIEYWDFLSVVGNLPVFILGASMFLFWRVYLKQQDSSLDSRRLLSATALVVAGTLYLFNLPFSYYHVVPESLILALLMLALLIHPWPAFVNRYTIGLGKISYSVYLLHFHVGRLVEHGLLIWSQLHPSTSTPLVLASAKFLLTLLLTVPCAIFTYRVIEIPGTNAGRWLIRKIEGQQPSSPQRPALNSGADTPDMQF